LVIPLCRNVFARQRKLPMVRQGVACQPAEHHPGQVTCDGFGERHGSQSCAPAAAVVTPRREGLLFAGACGPSLGVMGAETRHRSARFTLGRLARAPMDNDVFRWEAAEVLRRAVGFDTWCWVLLDPATGMPTRYASTHSVIDRDQRRFNRRAGSSMSRRCGALRRPAANGCSARHSQLATRWPPPTSVPRTPPLTGEFGSPRPVGMISRVELENRVTQTAPAA